MASILTILLPIFGLILTGYVCRRRNVFGPAAAGELNRFVVWLGLPSLLFDIIVHSSWQQLYQPGFIATFSLATTAVFAATLLVRLHGGRSMSDATVDAMAASYSNAGYVGFPLSLLAFGRGSQTQATIATIFVVCVLFGIALVLIELGLQKKDAGLGRVLLRLVSSLSRNPLIVIPAAGGVVVALGITLPASVETFFRLLGQAASPCALVSLGLFLAEKRPADAERRTPWLLAGTKLLLLPVLAWWLAAGVFDLSPAMVGVAVLLTALPTGTGPYMLAEYYKLDAAVTSRTILLSTVFSMVTLSVLLYLQRRALARPAAAARRLRRGWRRPRPARRGRR